MFSEVLFVGYKSVERFRGKRNTAVISILDFSERFARPDLSDFPRSLMLEFEDVSDGSEVLFGALLPDDTPEGLDRCPHNSQERFCTIKDALLIIDFLDSIQSDPRVKTLLVHCFGGVSRPAAVAQFVLDAYAPGNCTYTGMAVSTGKNPRLYRLLQAAYKSKQAGKF